MSNIDFPCGKFLSGAIAASLTTAVKSAELYRSDNFTSYCMSDFEIADFIVPKSFWI